MSRAIGPPTVLDNARVLAYAVIDESVAYTGDTCLIVDGRALQPAKGLAICQQIGGDRYLLFHCTKDWYVLGAAFSPSINDAKSYAEKGYRGVRAKWVEIATSEEAAREFMERDVRQVACSFCGELPEASDEITVGPTAAICERCFMKTYALFEQEGLV